MNPRASIIVATRNNARLLSDALASIVADSSRVERELIVVDNASTDETVEVALRASQAAPFAIRLVHEPTLGHSAARNAGVAAARGDILLFTDDDVIVEDGWADALVTAFDDDDVVAASGRTLALWPVPPPEWLNGPHRARLALFDFGQDDRDLEPGEAPAGANMAFRTAVLRRFDPPFTVRLGNHGDRRFAFEETYLVDHVRRIGRLVYVADAIVHHRIRSERMDLGWMRATYFDQGIARLRIEQLSGGAQPPDLARRIVRAWRACFGLWRTCRANDRGSRIGPETWDELRHFEWAGRHVELLLGRFPRLVTGVRDLLA